MPGPRDGFHCERDRFAVTNTVSGWPLRIVQMPERFQPPSSARRRPRSAPARTAGPRTRSSPSCGGRRSPTGPCCSRGCTPASRTSCRWSRPRRRSTPASCPRSSRTCRTTAAERPPLQRRRTSKMSALYQESPSLLFSSMVENAVFWRGVPAGMNGVPSAWIDRQRGVDVVAAQQVHAARSGVADRHRGAPPTARAAR